TSAPFRASDVGKRVIVAGAAAGPADLVAIITAYTSESVVTVSPGCTYGPGVTAANVEFGVAIVGDGTAGSDIILLQDQTDPTENGLYWANTGGALTAKRCSEPLVPGRAVIVSEGDRNAHTRYELVTQGAIVPDTTSLNFSRQNLVVNVGDFGAVADVAWGHAAEGAYTVEGYASSDDGTTAATPNADAIEAAIRALDPLSGGIVQFGCGGYRVEREVIIDRPCVIRGQGHTFLFSPTTIYCDKGVSGFRVGQGVRGLTNTGGDESGYGTH